MSMHPPANHRCQVYAGADDPADRNLYRCAKDGTHWEKWSGYTDDGEDDFYTWECDGAHQTEENAEAV